MSQVIGSYAARATFCDGLVAHWADVTGMPWDHLGDGHWAHLRCLPGVGYNKAFFVSVSSPANLYTRVNEPVNCVMCLGAREP